MRDALARSFGESFERTNRLLKRSEELCEASRIICADSNRIRVAIKDLKRGRDEPAAAAEMSRT